MNQQQYQFFQQQLETFLAKERFSTMHDFVQHGNITTLEHSILVAYYSYAFDLKLHLHSNAKELIKGALLHDYYLYDWHEKEAWHRWHGFRHPTFALKQALQDYHLTLTETDIIKKHMWPLTIIPPRYRESWIVCTIDTLSSLMETCMVHRPFGFLRKKWIRHILDDYELKIMIERKEQL